MYSASVIGILCFLLGYCTLAADVKTQPTPATPFSSALPKYEATAPIPGIPIPLDPTRAETLRLANIHIRTMVGQHHANYTVSCSVRRLDTQKDKTIQIALPLIYTPLQGSRKLPISRAITDINVSWGEKSIPFTLTEGPPPHAQLPSMLDWAGVRYWIIVDIKPKNETDLLTYRFTLPLAESGVQTPPTLLFRLSYLSAWGGARAEHGTLEAFFSEIYPTCTRNNMVSPEQRANGSLAWDFINHPTHDAINAVKIEVGGALSPDGKKWTDPSHPDCKVRIHSNYKITVNNTGITDPMGQPCSADNLKNTSGNFWKSDGVTIPEILITPDTPQRTLALLIRSGVSPEAQAMADPVARNHPETAFSLYARPSQVKININNGEKVYTARLRDDWQPQLLHLLDTGTPVKSVRLTLEQAYTGSGPQECYIQSIELVDPLR